MRDAAIGRKRKHRLEKTRLLHYSINRKEAAANVAEKQMETKIMKMNPAALEKELLAQAGAVIRAGGLVAFPTETVYGLGGNALDAEAAAKIYAAKGRPSDNPLIAHIAAEEELYRIAAEVPEAARKLMDAFWPGPLTMIFPKKEIVPDGTTGGLQTVAVRMPAHRTALALIEAAGVPIAAPSANLSGRPSPTMAEHVMEDLSGRIDLIIDGGSCDIGLESTIVDMTGEVPMILRPGYITREMLEEVVGTVALDPTLTDNSSVSGKPKAPGMKYRHYAPKAAMTMVSGEEEDVSAAIIAMAEASRIDGRKVGIICTEESREGYRFAGPVDVKVIGSRGEPAAIAHNLYRILREFDDDGVDVIYSETFAADNLGQAIMNRLTKAAGHRMIHV